jgi:tetratricopeptide (TPR) repeat protein
MIAKLMAPLRAAPATVPCLAAIVLFLVWAGEQAGYPLTHWAPGGIAVLGLLGLSLAVIGAPRWAVRGHGASAGSAVRGRGASPGSPVGDRGASAGSAVRGHGVGVSRGRAREWPLQVALACLAAYTALSFLSIAWAAAPGTAWEGADRTLLYLAVFALFASWPQQGTSAALVLTVWILGISGLALHALLHADAAHGAALQALFPGARLTYPVGYPNANAAQWLMAAWPALLLARGPRLPAALRGLLAACAVLLAEVALLSQSRGSLYATPAMAILVFAALPGRVRTFAVLVPVAAAIAAAAPAVLHVGDRLTAGGEVQAANVHSATLATILAALAAGAVLAAMAVAESRLGTSKRRRVRTALAAAAVAVLVGGLAGGAVAAGNPVTRVRSAWHSFKGGYSDSTSGSRLLSGLGSNRYDFYRVSLDEFLAHPIAGIGADNFQQQYLQHGRSTESPRYPHSVELRVLAQTGVLGALLAVVGLLAALVAVARALRRSDPLGQAVAAAAVAGFAYWVVHGSLDWFWEFAGLGAPAFALLGLACALGARRDAATRSAPQRSSAGGGATRTIGDGFSARTRAALGSTRLWIACAGVLVGVALAWSLAAPWISQLEIEQAARIWTVAPARAYAQLHDAAGVDPLSDEPDVLAGSIALRYGELPRADGYFAQALSRTPGDSYALLERGVIASARGDRSRALVLLSAAAHLSPRDGLIREALAIAREGRRVDVEALNRKILLKAEQLA